MPLQIHCTALPSKVICCDLDNHQFFHAQTRSEGLFGRLNIGIAEAILHDIVDLDRIAQQRDTVLDTPIRHFVKLRHLMIDEYHGVLAARVDYLHDQTLEPAFSESAVRGVLGDKTDRYLGFSQRIDAVIKRIDCTASFFSPLADEHYRV